VGAARRDDPGRGGGEGRVGHRDAADLEGRRRRPPHRASAPLVALGAGRAARALAACVAAAACALIAGAHAASAATSPETQLAQRYAPIVVLKKQAKPCDTHGEAYEPVAVNVVLNRADVTLRGPDGFTLQAPAARDLYGKDSEFFLDFPGNPLKPGCSYERWFRKIAEGKPATVYAHIATQPDRPGLLALQYWLYYVYNDWNNKHEGDWEMIQLVFRAGSVAEALRRPPIEVGYSQHSGAQRASWNDDSELERQGTHALVYSASGSHANFFHSALWFGYSAQAGVGCDDTRTPSRKVDPKVVVVPTTPSGADSRFAWLGYDGLWGRRLRSPNGGPTGPNVKTQWREPITWRDETWHDTALSVPGGTSLGPSATGFFCGFVAAGSKVYLRTLATPELVAIVVLVLVVAAALLVRQTRWRPGRATPVDGRRAGGEMFVSAWRIHAAYRRRFLALGAVFVPLGVLAAGIQAIVLDHTPFTDPRGVEGGDRFISGVAALLVGSGMTALIPGVLVAAAVAMSVDELAHGRSGGIDVRALGARLLPLAGATLAIIVVVALLSSTIVGLLAAVVFLVWHAITTQACVIERRPARAALSRSRELVHHQAWRVFAITGVATGIGLATGPVVGLAVLFASSASLGAIDIVSSVVYAVVMPYVSIVLVLLYFDLRAQTGSRA
jgi:VPS62-like protein